MAEAKKKTYQDKLIMGLISLLIGGGSGVGSSYLKERNDIKNEIKVEVSAQLETIRFVVVENSKTLAVHEVKIAGNTSAVTSIGIKQDALNEKLYNLKTLLK